MGLTLGRNKIFCFVLQSICNVAVHHAHVGCFKRNTVPGPELTLSHGSKRCDRGAEESISRILSKLMDLFMEVVRINHEINNQSREDYRVSTFHNVRAKTPKFDCVNSSKLDAYSTMDLHAIEGRDPPLS